MENAQAIAAMAGNYESDLHNEMAGHPLMPPVENPIDMDDGQQQDSIAHPTSEGHSPEAFSSDQRMPERDINDLNNPPPQIALVRKRLFEIQGRLEFKPEEFDRYWPFIDNVWVRQHKANTSKSGKTTTDYYACRLQRPTYTPKSSDAAGDGKPLRKKQIREGGTCQMRFKSVRISGPYSAIILTRIGDQDSHSHDLDAMDKIKRNSAVMEIARAEVMKGFMPASVFTRMNEEPMKLAAIGGKFLGRNDVRNASQAWRNEHKEPLAVHPGYHYDHGNGIVRDPNLSFSDGLNVPNPYDNDVLPLDPSLMTAVPESSGMLHFPPHMTTFLEPYLPPDNYSLLRDGLPFVTLTYASSIDSFLAIAHGVQTKLSGPQSKAMTHYLRSKHDAILIGVGTALVDNPTLNCRLAGVGGFGGLGWDGQPRPVVLDPGARWQLTRDSPVLKAVAEGKGRAPWIIIAPNIGLDSSRNELLKEYGGKYLGLSELDNQYRIGWEAILKALVSEGIRSVMVEGGGTVINELLQPEYSAMIWSVVVTIVPRYLGTGGVVVCPTRNIDKNGKPRPVTEFKEVTWQPMGEDVVMCGRIQERVRDT